MKVTEEQYKRDLEQPLKDLGYSKSFFEEFSESITYVGTNFTNCPSAYSNFSIKTKDNFDRYYIDHYNPKLFLALCAMTKGKNPIIGEYLYIPNNYSQTEGLKKGDIVKVTCIDYARFKTDKKGENTNTSLDYSRKATKEELIKHFNKNNMIDYTIRGTVLPEIAKGFSFRAVNWERESSRPLNNSYKEGELISYGSKIYNSEVYVLADNPGYKGKNYLMFKLEDLNNLTKQENIENKNIIGYKCPMDLWNGQIKKDEIIKKYDDFNYRVDRSSGGTTNISNIPKELAESWEPIYEDGFKVDDWVFWTGSYPTFAKIHKYNGGNCYTLNVNGNINSHNSCNEIHLRKATQEEIIQAQEQKVNINGIELTIKDNKVFHDKDNTDITEYVKAIKSLWEDTLNNGKMTLGKYDFTIDNISIRKTGCRTVNSNIKSWLDVAKMIK